MRSLAIGLILFLTTVASQRLQAESWYGWFDTYEGVEWFYLRRASSLVAEVEVPLGPAGGAATTTTTTATTTASSLPLRLAGAAAGSILLIGQAAWETVYYQVQSIQGQQQTIELMEQSLASGANPTVPEGQFDPSWWFFNTYGGSYWEYFLGGAFSSAG